MSDPCPICQKPIPDGAPAGLCPSCLVDSAARWWMEEGGGKAQAEAKHAQPSDEVGQRIGPYKLLQQIGEGGFGTVWMAEQEEPVRRRVALKIIKLGMDTREVVARFEQERQALAMMDHPNIAKVFDAGATVQGRPFFVMELVRGIRITDYCDRNNLPTADRLRLFISVCQAVQHAHQKGVIHRDLKPSNILVTLHDGAPVSKVIDFGVAKATQTRLTDKTLFTQFERMIGTPVYMSPEQAEMSGLDVDTRSDIYSLGVLLYELLVGRPPFDADGFVKRGVEEIRRLIREQEPPKPSTVLHTMAQEALTDVAHRRASEPPKLIRAIRGDLDWIVMKALEKDRTRRYETANGFAMDVQRYLNSEAVLARSPSTTYRIRKLVRRNRLAFAAVSAVVLALSLGLWASTVLYLRARSAEQEQAQLRSRAETTLAELRATAPTFQDQALKLVEEGRFEMALEKIGYAVKLADDDPAYRLFRAHLLEAMQRIGEAAAEYRRVLALRPADLSARKNLALCERFLAENGNTAALSREQQVTLVDFLLDQGRIVEAGPLVVFLQRDQSATETIIRARLKAWQNVPGWYDARLEKLTNGTFALQLVDLRISDLSILHGLPITRLNLDRCRVIDIRTLPALPLRELNVSNTGTRSISPLRGMPLEALDISDTPVSDLSPLAGSRLRSLKLTRSAVTDLTPLYGVPLEVLQFDALPITELSAVRGAPLAKVRAVGSKLADLSALAASPIQELIIANTPVSNLGPLAGSSIRLLDLTDCDQVLDYSPLLDCPSLETLLIPKSVPDLDSLRRLTRLKHIANRPLRSVGTSVDKLPSHQEFFESTGAQLFHMAELGVRLKELHQYLRKLGADDEALRLVTLNEKGVFDIYLGVLKISDISFLAGLPVGSLDVCGPVADLSPLAGAPLRRLSIVGAKVTDLSPLRGAPLEYLNLPYCPVRDLSPLADCRDLRDLRLANTPVSDVSSLAGLKLLELHLLDTPVEDASPLAGITTLKYLIAPRRAKGLAALRNLPNLERISFDWHSGIPQSADEFWSEFKPEIR